MFVSAKVRKRFRIDNDSGKVLGKVNHLSILVYEKLITNGYEVLIVKQNYK